MGTKPPPGSGTVPKRSVPVAPRETTSIARAALFNSWEMARAWGAKLKPWAVGSTPLGVRSKSLTARISSRPAIDLVIAG